MCSTISSRKLFLPRRIAILYLVVILALMLLNVQPAYASSEVPSGFILVTSSPGVQLYRKDYPNGTPDFVQIIDLGLGAEIIPMHGEVTDSRSGKGAYGGPDARIRSQPLNRYWQELKDISSTAFCVNNGQFFYMRESPTRLPFPLRVDGQVVSDGYGLREFPKQKLLLLLWLEKADIVPLEKESLYGTTALHAIAGLTEDARKSPTKYVGRTFIGVDDANGDGTAEIVLVFSTHSARQKDAAGVLRSFGADKVMMFDGGGSAQLTCQGKAYVASDRLIPQAFGVLAAPEEYLPGPELVEVPAQNSNPLIEVEEQIPEQDTVANNETPNEEPTLLTPSVEQITNETPLYAVNFEDVVWVPTVMAPVMAVVLFVLIRQRLNA